MSDPRAKGRRQAEKELAGNAGYAQAEEYVEESGGITVRTMKRAGRFMWASIFFLILTILLVAGYLYMYDSSVVSIERACWMNQQNVETLSQRYVTENGFSSMPAYVEDIPGFDNVVKECEAGGAYTWNPITGQFSCSEHGHWPEGFNQAQSILRGTTTVMIEAD